MANEKHLKILKQGVEAWNEWRGNHENIRPNLIDANLFGADLSEVNLGGADLRGTDFTEARLLGAYLNEAELNEANLHGACLRGAHLIRAHLHRANVHAADLHEADLRGAHLLETHLRGAHLGRANLGGANLRGADLVEANLRGARLYATVFGNNDLSTVKGLESVWHEGPSTIGIDTIYRSKGNIPESFLRGAGVPEDFIVYMKSLVGKAIEFYSCFISHSSRDQDFADRLYEGLKAKDVRCWYFPEDAKWGEPVWGEIDRSIKVYDKLVVICSENSLQSEPVIREIERALQREDREHKNILFPVRIDDYLFGVWQHARKADVESKVVGDFRNWKDHDAYTKAFNRLLEALNKPEK